MKPKTPEEKAKWAADMKAKREAKRAAAASSTSTTVVVEKPTKPKAKPVATPSKAAPAETPTRGRLVTVDTDDDDWLG